jgi:hypothetical protein
MKIRHLQLPSGTTEGIPFLIDANLSTEQAVAVFELPDDLREQILLRIRINVATDWRFKPAGHSRFKLATD